MGETDTLAALASLSPVGDPRGLWRFMAQKYTSGDQTPVAIRPGLLRFPFVLVVYKIRFKLLEQVPHNATAVVCCEWEGI